MTMTRSICLGLLLTLAAVSATAQDDLYLEITRAGMSQVSVASPPFLVLPGTPADVAARFQATLDRDLEAAAPIALLDRQLYALVEHDPRPEVLHQRWRAVGAQFLLTGSVVTAGGQIVVEARLTDLVSGELAFSKRYRAGASAAEVVAHTLANDLVQVFTGRPGPFLSKIAFISNRSGSSELWLMDWDGANPRQLTKHGSLALSPDFSPDGRQIAFTSYLRGSPDIYLLTPQEGYLRPLYTDGGVNSSSSFDPSGERIAFASAVDGNADIYVISTAGGTATRLTSTRAIDTQPAFSPSGRQIAFTSVRGGTPQLYLMDSDGANVRRLTFEGGFFDEAAWAPDGTRIACTTRAEGKFKIATVDVASGQTTIIPAPGNNESPVFSPDGSMLAFVSDRTGTPQIYLTDAEGRPRQLTHAGTNHSPSWVNPVP